LVTLGGASLSSTFGRFTMNTLLYIAAGLWVAGWVFIVYLYFAPCRCGLNLNRPASFRQAFFDLAAAFFFVPVAMVVYLRQWIRERHTDPEER
jgi:hypothetical protein